MNLRETVDIPPLWLAGFAALAYGQAAFLGPDLLGPDFLGPDFLGPDFLGPALGRLAGWYAGAGLLVAGILLMLAAALQFLRRRTTIVPHREAAALITSGPYRLSRNPIYLADALILAGLCLGWGAVSGLVLVPAFMAVIQRRFILPEEARLRAAFGAEFQAWAVRTRRWL